MSPSVGIVGLGIMGGAFAKNLLEAGMAVTGYDILPDKIRAIEALGAAPAASPADVAEKSDIVITSLPSIASLHEVMTGKDGIASSAKSGLIVVECSTMPLADKHAAHDALDKAGIILLDCTISGTGGQAVVKDLAVYGSGDKAAYEKALPVIEAFSRVNSYVGEFGNGSKVKFIANHLVQVHNVATAEALVLAMKAGLDPQMVFDVITAGAGTSRVFEIRGPMMVKDDYDNATMKIDVWKKDMQVIGDFAKALDCPMPLFSACTELYRSALAKGLGKKDTAAVCMVLEEMANLKR